MSQLDLDGVKSRKDSMDEFKAVTDKVGQIIYLSLDQLHGMQGKLKTLDKESYQKFRSQILENGFISPFHIWIDDKGKNTLFDGHTRLYTLQMMKQEGVHIPEKLPAITVKASSRQEAAKFLMAMVSQYGKANEESLSDFAIAEGLDYSWLQANTDIPYVDLTFEEPQVESDGSEDEVPEVVEPKAKLGQIYKLGEHRLMCGDSTDEAQVAKLMDGKKADMVFTDPPYGVDYQGGAMSKRKKLDNDHKKTNIYQDVIPVICEFTEDKAPIYIWHAAGYADMASHIWENGLEIRSQIIWNKNMAQFGALSAQYKQKHEPCFYCFKSGKAPHWYGPTNEVTVWDVKRESKNEFHPTQKPVELVTRALQNSSKSGDSVLDLFGGSGSTLIGCESKNRKAYLMELDPHYVDVIIARWQQYTGKTAELIHE